MGQIGKKAREELKRRLMEELHEMGQVSDEELYERIDQAIARYGQQVFLPLKDRIQMRRGLFDSFRRLDILQELVDDPDITEIMVNGKDDVFVEQKGQVLRWGNGFDTTEQLEDMIQQIVSRVNRRVNVASPIADARLEDGSRVHVVLPPIALNGPVVTIRKFPEPITIKRLVELGAVSREAVRFLERLVKARYNIFISGGTNSGKSTFLNALSSFIPEDERVITIEDSAELQIQHVPNLVRLETRGPNTEGEGAVEIADLIKASLRMNPDRVIVGEVRGKEALDMLSAFNTGHDGSFSTGHGNSPKDMLTRLETMVLMGSELPLAAVRGQIAAAIDILVHLGRLRDKSRKVLSIMEVGGYKDGEIQLFPLFHYEEGELKKTGELRAVEKLRAAGYEV